jgi:predicted GNAT family N-acyltransferase
MCEINDQKIIKFGNLINDYERVTQQGIENSRQVRVRRVLLKQDLRGKNSDTKLSNVVLFER